MTKYLAIFLALSAGAYAGVDGTVVNRTAGKPQPGVEVTLSKLGQAGPQPLETVKTDAQGKFQFKQDLPVGGPSLLEASYAGVVYNRMLPPGSSASNVEMTVFDSSDRSGTAQVAEHMVVLQPAAQQLSVDETFLFENKGSLTYKDSKNGTLRFYVPQAAGGNLRVMATEPGGLPLEQPPAKTKQADVYMLDFPIKPGETRIEITYPLPPGTFAGKTLYKGGPTRLVVPNGVALEGPGVEKLGQEPTTQAIIYGVKGAEYTVQVAGTGSIQPAADDMANDSGPSIQEILPRIYDNLALILIPALLALALGFTLLYRKA